jgi:hypothetical protein
MLRIFLFGPPNRRKQPERYAKYNLKFMGIVSAAIRGGTKNILKITIDII